MVVDATHRRAGVGNALMKALAQHTLEANKSWVSLTALKDNAHAQAFYSSLGMTRVNVDFFAIGKTALTIMQKS
jgi:ribosomal protein S18 acetylase RimI-like enzyme